VSCWSSVHLAHAAIKLGTEGTKAQELNFIVSLLLFVFLLGIWAALKLQIKSFFRL
jgi:hypothetical protein